MQSVFRLGRNLAHPEKIMSILFYYSLPRFSSCVSSQIVTGPEL